MDAEKKPNPSSSTTKGQAWFCTTGLPSDVVIEVEDMTFHLHKFPLISKSSKLNLLIAEGECKPSPRHRPRQQDGHSDEIQEEEFVPCCIQLDGFPGGSDTFEAAAKFCYGVKVELTPSTVAPLRCAGEFLGMTEEYSEDNLISKTEKYFVQVTLRNIRDALRVLKSCDLGTENMEIAESLEIPQRCIEAIVANAPTTDPALFGWPIPDRGLHHHAPGANRRKSRHDRESWLEDLSILALPTFKRLIIAMIEGNLSVDLIETCLMHYTKKRIPGIIRSARKLTESPPTTEIEQRDLLVTVISNLTPSRSVISTKFLFGLLRTANILKISDDFRVILEKKIGCQLEEAMLDDLLIPSYSYLNETLYDVDCVERILAYFLERNEKDGLGGDTDDDTGRSTSLIMVGKLIDGYLSEIASDSNLKPEKFYELATSLPEKARLFDDGLYRSVDVYLKAHPWASEADREKICGIIDCQKLTLEACTHAAQNERLPLRSVVQVLFFEQLQLRHAIAGTLLAAEATVGPQGTGRLSGSRHHGEDEEEAVHVVAAEGDCTDMVTSAVVRRGSTTWHAAVRENQVLRLDMDSMRTRVHQLERECSTMKKVISEIDKDGPNGGGWRGSLSRKFGCKFSTQVCDSQDRAVVEGRRGRTRTLTLNQQQHLHRS
ncbi:hypothetical protein MLD38_031199 [Melastoma candidum]|uniref:Uncharacterized protein n=1 Tax=Melastoma candidum TaxID=119954 RepID=A0ACB9MTU7_9MYRT|nr:hypothetical protein MLD38_031199 [Melastoma candidum]